MLNGFAHSGRVPNGAPPPGGYYYGNAYPGLGAIYPPGAAAWAGAAATGPALPLPRSPPAPLPSLAASPPPPPPPPTTLWDAEAEQPEHAQYLFFYQTTECPVFRDTKYCPRWGSKQCVYYHAEHQRRRCPVTPHGRLRYYAEMCPVRGCLLAS
jgi:hypothetical protein